MARVGDAAELARVLPGVWHIRASSGPYWTTGTRKRPRVTVSVTQRSPLELLEIYEYHREDKGDREFEARAVWRGSHFAWTNGADPESTSAFVVSDTPATPDVIALHHADGADSDAWVSIWSRESMALDDVRALVSRDTYSFELSADEFWQLTWLVSGDS